ncbi:delta-1-pyrroline-5-carboxylate dehydrogenase [Marininema mesophilum]|uniref:L-glutamate gamma-semialdehyde dehydrogenase n=1 Tax=Marininema mesophilum TaxID=1048340 RepID=A0A1H2YN64_9BACL|nr:L-glutamate gamma-semialdehyde dehydrogenase [Marininema mesophilum]SDX06673.1 delta-1-pyrroline-5-carboxylate dehydrogenase [Marininema mesophilum]
MIPYKNDDWTDFTVSENHQDMKESLANFESELGREYPLIIGGERIFTEDKLVSINPYRKDQVVGKVSKADQELAEKAIQNAYKAFDSWRKWPAHMRADILFKSAAIIRRRRHEFSATMVFESGKNWFEADADTSEAVDFLEYYGRQMLELDQGKTVISRQDEKNRYFYQSMGVGFIVPPWNFPFAIMVGTTVSALVTGNTVVLKPSEKTPVVAARFIEVLEEAGLPEGVLQFVPGDPKVIGDYIVDHPLIRFINFTGSRATGTRIYERAAKVHPGQKWFKRVVAEMGGKDTILVDRDADLDLAARSIVTSSFGFSGQKCSACSRAVLHQDIYDEVLQRVIALTKELKVGNPADPDMDMGPVIDDIQFNRIREYIAIGKEEGELVLGGETDDSQGFMIQPTIIAGVKPDARIMLEEVFGPLLAVAKAKDFDELLEIANNTEYALTGALLTRSREHIERARHDFQVGNLYFNRGCTGSIVGVHPFGGFNMSGTDAKAGGPDYLLNFLLAKTTTENL